MRTSPLGTSPLVVKWHECPDPSKRTYLFRGGVNHKHVEESSRVFWKLQNTQDVFFQEWYNDSWVYTDDSVWEEYDGSEAIELRLVVADRPDPINGPAGHNPPPPPPPPPQAAPPVPEASHPTPPRETPPPRGQPVEVVPATPSTSEDEEEEEEPLDQGVADDAARAGLSASQSSSASLRRRREQLAAEADGEVPLASRAGPASPPAQDLASSQDTFAPPPPHQQQRSHYSPSPSTRRRRRSQEPSPFSQTSDDESEKERKAAIRRGKARVDEEIRTSAEPFAVPDPLPSQPVASSSSSAAPNVSQQPRRAAGGLSAAQGREVRGTSEVSMVIGMVGNTVAFVPRSPDRPRPIIHQAPAVTGTGTSQGATDEDATMADDELSRIDSSASPLSKAKVKASASSPLFRPSTDSSSSESERSRNRALKHHSSEQAPAPAQSFIASPVRAASHDPEATTSTHKRKPPPSSPGVASPIRQSPRWDHSASKRARFNSGGASSPSASTSKLPPPSARKPVARSTSRPSLAADSAGSQPGFQSGTQSTSSTQARGRSQPRPSASALLAIQNSRPSQQRILPRVDVSGPSRWNIILRRPTVPTPPFMKGQHKPAFYKLIFSMGAASHTKGVVLYHYFKRIEEWTGWHMDDIRLRYTNEKGEDVWVYGWDSPVIDGRDLEDLKIASGAIFDIDYVPKPNLEERVPTELD